MHKVVLFISVLVTLTSLPSPALMTVLASAIAVLSVAAMIAVWSGKRSWTANSTNDARWGMYEKT